ncbi:hypothetical protein GYMLUDRAFT_98055 [Collybiopsis luxurians FD-317 M1]|uniref:G-protein coupled receptors family 1 profile domain-containing protein n=1 Tax=Collybiopsis luxurians FD-317 M1 TaxID=944289 RepID=A0A0D0CJN0_9AGAR|nr:hypothetical protein GYMLUDRAFT_98055 [Collybiopsis luxurians FD-317 M1]
MEDSGEYDKLYAAFVALEFSGGLGMSVLFASALLSQTRFMRQIKIGSSSNEVINRSQTWFSFCISWIISCISYCLLFFAGQQFDLTQPPTYGLCLTQAALIYSSPPLTGATTFALFLDLWLMYRAASRNQRSGLGRTVRISLLILPYILWILLTVALLIVGLVKPDTVERKLASDPFCVLTPNIVPLVICSLTLVFALGVLAMLILLSITLHRTRKEPALYSKIPSQSQKQLSALAIRMMVFSGCAMIAITLSTIFVFNRAPGIRSDLALAVLPPVGALVFGSQKDFVQFWSNLLIWATGSILPWARKQSDKGQPEQVTNQSRVKDRNEPEIIEMEIAPTIGSSDEIFLILPHDEEQVLVSPRRMHIKPR